MRLTPRWGAVAKNSKRGATTGASFGVEKNFNSRRFSQAATTHPSTETLKPCQIGEPLVWAQHVLTRSSCPASIGHCSIHEVQLAVLGSHLSPDRIRVRCTVSGRKGHRAQLCHGAVEESTRADLFLTRTRQRSRLSTERSRRGPQRATTARIRCLERERRGEDNGNGKMKRLE